MGNWYQTTSLHRLERSKPAPAYWQKPSVQDELSFSRMLQSKQMPRHETKTQEPLEIDEYALHQAEYDKRLRESGLGEPSAIVFTSFSQGASPGERNTDLPGYSQSIELKRKNQNQSLIGSSEQVVEWLGTKSHEDGSSDWQLQITDANGEPIDMLLRQSPDGDWHAEVSAQLKARDFDALALAMNDHGVVLKRTRS